MEGEGERIKEGRREIAKRGRRRREDKDRGRRRREDKDSGRRRREDKDRGRRDIDRVPLEEKGKISK